MSSTCITTVIVIEMPVVGVAKRLVQLTNNPDGSATMTFEFNIENFGDVVLDSIQVLDTLINTFPAPCALSVLSLTSDDFIVNQGFNGITDFGLLVGSDDLPIGDKGSILLTINAATCQGTPQFPGPFFNSATACAVGQSGIKVSDRSANGADPDPNGDGIPDEMSDTEINFMDVTAIGIAKNVVVAQINPDGTFGITYEFNIENFSSVNLSMVQAVDNLSAAFPPPCVVTVVSRTSNTFTVNTDFDGVNDFNLLTGSDGLLQGLSGSILIEISVDSCDNLGPFINTATVSALTPTGATVQDESVDGTDPDPNGDGIPDEMSPTIVDFNEDPRIGAAKRVSQTPLLDADNNFVFTYEIRVENLGDTNLDSIQVADSLDITFGGASSWMLLGVESEEFTVNPAFDGITNINLLIGDDQLDIGNEGAVYVTVKVAPGGNPGPYMNTAWSSGKSPLGTLTRDASQNGSEPDPNGDGFADDNNEPTPVTLGCFVEIICPLVADTIFTPNDLGWCRAVVNLPPAEIITCGGAQDSLIEYMLEGQGAEGIATGVWIEGQPSGLQYIVGSTTVSLRASIPSQPELGFSDTCTFVIVVEDKEKPEVVCKDIFVEVDDGCSVTITPGDIDAGSTDNCMIDTLLISEDGINYLDSITFDVSNLSEPFVQITLQVIDTAGNISLCFATVTVLDSEAPVVECVEDFTIETAPGACYGVVPNLLPPPLTSDNCDPLINIDQLPEPGLVFGSMPGDSIEVFIIVTDVDGNMDTCSTIIYTVDLEPPMFENCPRPNIVVKALSGMCGAFVNFSLPEAQDNCVGVTVTQTDNSGMTSGDFYPIGKTLLEYIATDASGNTDSCSLTIIVNDDQDPLITCPDDITVVNAPGECGNSVNNISPVSVEDNCPDQLAVVYKILSSENPDSILAAGIEDASGSDFGCGTSTVTYTAYDQSLIYITEVTQELQSTNGGTNPLPAFIPNDPGDDYLEFTVFGPGSIDLSCLIVERISAVGSDTFLIPAYTVASPGDVITIHFGDGLDDPANLFYNLPGAADFAPGNQATYLISFEGLVLDVVSVNGHNANGLGESATVQTGDWNGVLDISNTGSAYRKFIFDNNVASDFETSNNFMPATIGFFNPGLPVFEDNGTTSGLQSLPPNSASCLFSVTLVDAEAPICGQLSPSDYSGESGNISSGELLNSVINISDDYVVGDVNVLELNITHADISELGVKLISPEGTEVLLFAGLCPGEPDLDLSLDSDSTTAIQTASCISLGNGEFFSPVFSLDAFVGESSLGQWTLQIADNTDANDGVLNGWTLVLSESTSYAQGDTILINDPGICGATFGWRHPTVLDNCIEGTVDVVYSSLENISVPMSGSVIPGTVDTAIFTVGTTIVSYTITDKAGNTGSL